MSSGGLQGGRNFALDGLRGLAVGAVLIYHVWPEALPGGYLGVSVFFTLSGFLITTLLLDEWRRTASVDARQFWSRRARRLLPAAIAALALAVAVTAIAGDADQLRSIDGDVVGASTYIANWRFISLGRAYGATYLEPSPLLHTWSLAIEEQFYVVLGLVAFLVARRARTLRPWCLVVGLIAAGSVASTVWLQTTQGAAAHDRIYFGTDTRAFELAAGMALAIALHARLLPRGRTAAVVTAVGGGAALVALTAASVLVDERSPVLRQGGFWVVALLSVAVVAAVTVPSPLTRVLAWKPLVGLGVISYGVYLYHWPLLTLLTPSRIHLDGVALGAVQISVSLALAILSFRFLEEPIRRQRWSIPMRRFVPGAFAVSLIVLVCALFVGGLAARRAIAGDIDIALPVRTEVGSATEVRPLSPDPASAGQAQTAQTATVSAPTLRTVLFLGDSLVHQGFPTMVDELATAGIDATAIGGPAENFLTNDGAWLPDLEAALDRIDPDIVVLEGCCGVGLHQGADNDADVPWADNPLMRVWEQRSIAASDMATAHGALVLWIITPPAEEPSWYGRIEERMEAIRRFNLHVAACRRHVDIIDWRVLANADGSYAAALPDRDNKMVEVRAQDGLHFTPAGQRLVAQITRRDLLRAWAAHHAGSDEPVATEDCSDLPPPPRTGTAALSAVPAR